VATLQDFLTVTQLLPGGGGWTAAATVGTNGVASSPWKTVNKEFGPTALSIGCVISGTVNYTVEYTYDDPNNTLGNGPAIPQPWSHATLVNKAVSADGIISSPIYAWRLTLNSGTGAVTATGIQAGIVN
jgi:hypothetical protein